MSLLLLVFYRFKYNCLWIRLLVYLYFYVSISLFVLSSTSTWRQYTFWQLLILTFWDCELKITFITSRLAVTLLCVFPFDINLLDTIFTSSYPLSMTVFWYSDKILSAFIAYCYTTLSTMMLSIENIERILAQKA